MSSSTSPTVVEVDEDADEEEVEAIRVIRITIMMGTTTLATKNPVGVVEELKEEVATAAASRGDGDRQQRPIPPGVCENCKCRHGDATCNNCGESGHGWRCCKHNYKGNRQNSASGPSGNGNQSTFGSFVGLIRSSKSVDEVSIPLPSQATYHKLKIDHLAAAIAGVVWIIDSGATIHVSGDRNLFKNLRHSHAKVETADGSILPIKCMGDCMIQLPGGSDLTLTQVLFVPGIKVNLISVAAFGDKGIGCYFPAGRPAYLYKGQHVAFTDNVKQQYLLRTEASKAMGLREVKGPAQIQWEEDSHHTFKMAKETTNIEIWHRRFAHLGYRNVLSNVKKVIGMEVKGPIPEEACEPCLKVKQ